MLNRRCAVDIFPSRNPLPSVVGGSHRLVGDVHSGLLCATSRVFRSLMTRVLVGRSSASCSASLWRFVPGDALCTAFPGRRGVDAVAAMHGLMGGSSAFFSTSAAASFWRFRSRGTLCTGLPGRSGLDSASKTGRPSISSSPSAPASLGRFPLLCDGAFFAVIAGASTEDPSQGWMMPWKASLEQDGGVSRVHVDEDGVGSPGCGQDAAGPFGGPALPRHHRHRCHRRHLRQNHWAAWRLPWGLATPSPRPRVSLPPRAACGQRAIPRRFVGHTLQPCMHGLRSLEIRVSTGGR